MNTLLQKIRELMAAGKAFLQMPDRIRGYMQEFVDQGGITINTTYTYQDQNTTAHEIRFRTSIQPDGDVIHFIPDPELFAANKDWEPALQDYANAHLQEVSKFYQNLERLQQLGTKVSQMIGSLIGTISALFIDVGDEIRQLLAPLWEPLVAIHPFLGNIFWFFIITVVLGGISGLIFFYVLKPAVFGLVMRRFKRMMGK